MTDNKFGPLFLLVTSEKTTISFGEKISKRQIKRGNAKIKFYRGQIKCKMEC
jgi:hypothetical protein